MPSSPFGAGHLERRLLAHQHRAHRRARHRRPAQQRAPRLTRELFAAPVRGAVGLDLHLKLGRAVLGHLEARPQRRGVIAVVIGAAARPERRRQGVGTELRRRRQRQLVRKSPRGRENFFKFKKFFSLGPRHPHADLLAGRRREPGRRRLAHEAAQPHGIAWPVDAPIAVDQAAQLACLPSRQIVAAERDLVVELLGHALVAGPREELRPRARERHGVEARQPVGV
ncbi:MAG: hypothetical protein MUF34_19920 [Polyangiaceae bacterium]|nr:hypothetical protein [Polyangiaceae bacterium]